MGALYFLEESIFSDEYASRKGFLQARDARFRVLILLSCILAVLFSRSIVFIIGIYALTLFLAVISSIRIGFFLKRTWVFIPVFALFIALPALLDILSPGEPVLSFGVFGMPFAITREGIMSASFFFMRVLSSVSLCALMILTTRHQVLLRVLRIFGIPQLFVLTLGMTYRYIYLFIGIIHNTYLAIKSRVGFFTSARGGRKIVAWNIAGLWHYSYLLHHQVYNAMLSRGYTGEPKVMDRFSAGFKDLFWLGFSVLILVFILWQSYYLN
jgi:cobalt/nickel transport system permease protein